jgi:hypothetical protein
MISTNKFEPKHLKIEGTRRARKTDENSSKKTQKPNKLQTGIDARKLPFTQRSDSLQTEEKSNPREQGNEKQIGWMVCLETLKLIYMSPLRARQKTTLPLALKL